MIRAIRFAGSHDLAIEPAAWEAIRELAPTITRAAPARLYEEMLKLFLLGAALPVFNLLETSGLMASLFPGFDRWLDGRDDRRAMVQKNLEGLDRLGRSGLAPSPGLFLSALFGPGVEDGALARHRDGVPYMQALDAACAVFREDFCKVVSVPGRIGGQLRGILALQPSLHRMPPRRPASLASRPDFANAMSYLCLMARTREENKATRQWWEAFLEDPSAAVAVQANGDAPAGRRRKKRRRRRPAAAAAGA